MNPLFLRLLLLFSNNITDTPKSLEKKENGFMDRHYETILKSLFTVLIILCILSAGTLFVLFIIHGGDILGTEANTYQRLVSVVAG